MSAAVGQFPYLEDCVRGLVDEGIYATALQLSWEIGRDKGGLAVGNLARDVPVRDDHLFSVHCATKPLVALGLARLMDARQIRLEDEVGTHVSGTSKFRSLHWTIGEVLSHQAPLASPLLAEINLCPEGGRSVLELNGLDLRLSGYSEYLASAICCEIIENCVGTSAEKFLSTDVIALLADPFNLMMSVAPDDELTLNRIGFYVVGLPSGCTYMLSDRSVHQASQDRSRLGGYGSAQGLCSLYASLGRRLRGEEGFDCGISAHSIRALLDVRSAARWVATLRKTCAFSAGFMIGLDEHGFGSRVSRSAFGHTGFMGTSAGFHDPAIGLSFAVIANGIPSSIEDSDVVRQTLVDALYRDIGT